MHANYTYQSQTPAHARPSRISHGPRVPTAIREQLEQALHTNFSDVVLRERSPVPVAIGALALVRGLEVHLSPAVGSLDNALARHTLAREFVHLTQNTAGVPIRRIGSQRVAHSPALERDADVRAASALRGDLAPPTGPLAAPRPVPTAQCKKSGKDESLLPDRDGLHSDEYEETSSSDTEEDDVGPLLAQAPRSDGADARLTRTSGQTASQIASAAQSVVAEVSSGAGHAIGAARFFGQMHHARERANGASLQIERVVDPHLRRVLAYVILQSERKYRHSRNQAFIKLCGLVAGAASVATAGVAAPAVGVVAVASTAISLLRAIKNLKKRVDGTLGVERKEMAQEVYNIARGELEEFDVNGPFLQILMGSGWGIDPADLVNDDKLDMVVSIIAEKLRST